MREGLVSEKSDAPTKKVTAGLEINSVSSDKRLVKSKKLKKRNLNRKITLEKKKLEDKSIRVTR